MTELTAQAILDVTILAEMYGDDSAQTISQVLAGFRSEATIYFGQLQQAFAEQENIEIARLSHSLKSMAGLIGANQLMLWCQIAEQAARQHDQPALTRCWLELDNVQPALLLQLDSSLRQHGVIDA